MKEGIYMKKNKPKITITRNWIRINHTLHLVPKHIKEANKFNACIVLYMLIFIADNY